MYLCAYVACGVWSGKVGCDDVFELVELFGGKVGVEVYGAWGKLVQYVYALSYFGAKGAFVGEGYFGCIGGEWGGAEGGYDDGFGGGVGVGYGVVGALA